MRPLKLTYLSVLAVMLTAFPAFGNEHFGREGESYRHHRDDHLERRLDRKGDRTNKGLDAGQPLPAPRATMPLPTISTVRLFAWKDALNAAVTIVTDVWSAEQAGAVAGMNITTPAATTVSKTTITRDILTAIPTGRGDNRGWSFYHHRLFYFCLSAGNW